MYKLSTSRKGQQIFVSMMVSILALIVLIIIVSPLKTEISKATNGTYSTYLNSSNPSLAVEHKATVIILDMSIFYYIGIMIAASLAYITGKKSITGAITAIMVFVVVSVLISPLKSLIVLARDSTHLDCTSATITVGGKLACIVTDIWLFYFFIAMVSVAISYIFVTKVIKK